MKSKTLNRGAVGLGLIFTVLLIGYFLPRPLSTGVAACSTENKLTVPSPDGAYQAVIYQATCKPTGSVSMHVSITPTDAKFLPDTFPAVFSVEGAEPPTVSWSGPRAVSIAAPPGKVTLVKTDGPDGIAITYP